MELTSRELAKFIVSVLDDHKAQDIKIIGVEGLTILGDYFVIASGGSTTQVKALADNVEKKLAERGIMRSGAEGKGSASWILLDYGDVIVHIFHRETRAFYNLERLWTDGVQLTAQTL